MKAWPLNTKILWGVILVIDFTVLLLSFVIPMSVFLIVSVVPLSLILMALIFVLRENHTSLMAVRQQREQAKEC